MIFRIVKCCEIIGCYSFEEDADKAKVYVPLRGGVSPV